MDVFISYSTKNADAAKAVCYALEEKGIRCWIAPRDIPPGCHYGDMIDTAIMSSKVFLLVYSKDSLESQWCNGELNVAFSEGKTILPYRIEPAPLKGAMKVILSQTHWIDSYPDYKECFEDLVQAIGHIVGKKISVKEDILKEEKLQPIRSDSSGKPTKKKWFHSCLRFRSHSGLRRSLRWVVGIIAALLVIYLVIIRSMLVLACKEEVAEYLTEQVRIAELLLEDNLKLSEEWERYTPEDKDAMLMTMALVEKNTEEYRNIYSAASFEMSSWHNLLSAVARADTFTLSTADEHLEYLFETQLSDVEYIRCLMDMNVIYPSVCEDVGAVLEVFPHMVNSFYYSYLQVINTLPESAREAYYEVVKDFDKMPKIGLGLKDKDYEILMMHEFKLADKFLDEMANVEVMIMMEDEGYRLETKMDSLNRSIVSLYKDAVAKNTISATDSIWLNWGKICNFAGFLEVSVSYEMETSESDEYYKNPIPPQVTYWYLSKMLDDFTSLYPSSAPYTRSVNVFYREVSELKRSFKGVLVASFAEGQSHDFYQLGDIIVSWNGVEVGTYNELVAASKMKDGDGKVRILRLDGDSFKELHVSIPGNEGIVGFNNLRLGDE